MTSTSRLVEENEYYERQILANLAAADIYLYRIGRAWEFLTFQKPSGGSLGVVDVELREIALAAPLIDFSIQSINAALQILHQESARALTESTRKQKLTKL